MDKYSKIITKTKPAKKLRKLPKIQMHGYKAIMIIGSSNESMLKY